VLVDVTRASGRVCCASLRAISDVPILAIGHTGDEEGLVAALGAGADSYASKRATPREIVARLRALLRRSDLPTRRSAEEGPPVLASGSIRLDRVAGQAWVGDDQVVIAVPELAILEALLQRPGKVVSRGELAQRLGDGAYALDVHVRRLRDALEADGRTRQITAIRGVGFRLEPSEVMA